MKKSNQLWKKIAKVLTLILLCFVLSCQQQAVKTEAEENKDIIRRVVEDIWNKGNLNIIDELHSVDIINHALPPGHPQSIEGEKQFMKLFRTAFPDQQFTIEDMIAEGDKVVIRHTYRGIHKGEFMGIAPTDNQITTTGITIFRLADGKIYEVWANYDQLGLMQHLGMELKPIP